MGLTRLRRLRVERLPTRFLLFPIVPVYVVWMVYAFPSCIFSATAWPSLHFMFFTRLVTFARHRQSPEQ